MGKKIKFSTKKEQGNHPSPPPASSHLHSQMWEFGKTPPKRHRGGEFCAFPSVKLGGKSPKIGIFRQNCGFFLPPGLRQWKSWGCGTGGAGGAGRDPRGVGASYGAAAGAEGSSSLPAPAPLFSRLYPPPQGPSLARCRPRGPRAAVLSWGVPGVREPPVPQRPAAAQQRAEGPDPAEELRWALAPVGRVSHSFCSLVADR